MLLDDIGDYLSSGGVGTLATDLFLGELPDTPDTCVAVFETGGFDPVYTMKQRAPVAKRPSIQVICRAKRYDVARLLAGKVDQLLSGLRYREINGVMYKWIQAQQEPFFIDKDENEREEIGCNYSIICDSTST